MEGQSQPASIEKEVPFDDYLSEGGPGAGMLAPCLTQSILDLAYTAKPVSLL